MNNIKEEQRCFKEGEWIYKLQGLNKNQKEDESQESNVTDENPGSDVSEYLSSSDENSDSNEKDPPEKRKNALENKH